MEESRKQFDEWYKRATEDADAESKKAFELMMWTAWVASRSAIEIEWPSRGIDSIGGTYHRRDDMRDVLESAGLRVKEK